MKWWVWVLIGVGGLVVLGIIGSALGDSEDGSTSVPTRAPVAAASPTSPPAAVAATPTAIPTTTAVVAATPQPTPTSEPKSSLDAGTYRVGTDIAPGIYAGRAGAGLFGSCYWERLSGVSGTFEEIIANDNANGQFYIEAKPDDKYLKTDCEITPLEDWPAPAQPLTDIGPGTYLVGRDITPGTYRGEAGTDVMSSCYWARLAGLSGDFDDLIANDNATGQFFVEVTPSDYALNTGCDLTWLP